MGLFGRSRLPESARAAIDALIGDLRFATRYFARHAVTTAILVAVIALGTGANALVFSIVQSQFFRPAPAVPEDESNALIWPMERETQTAEWKPRRVSLPELTALAERRDVFADVAAWTEDEVTFHDGDGADARVIGAQFVTPNFFSTVGVRVVAGRSFDRGTDDTPDMTAVMSYGLAEVLYDNPAAAVGRHILLNGMPAYVVGVAPPGFQGARRGSEHSAIWIPMSARADIARVPRSTLTTENAWSLVTRLAPGVSRDQATALTRSVVTNALPDSARREGPARTAYVLAMHELPPGDDRTEDIFVFAFFMAMGILMLLVAWTNVSSLMVAAAVGRRHEIAVRLSLGASRLRLVCQLLTESVMLALAGSAIGLTLAWWGLTYLSKTGLLGTDLAPDLATFAYVVVAAFATGISFGLSPALHATGGRLATARREFGAGGHGRAGARGRANDQRRFVALQIALSQPLLVVLGVVIAQVVSDYRPLPPELSRHALTIALRPSPATQGQGRDTIASLVARIAERPDVVGAAPEPSLVGVRDVQTASDAVRVKVEAVAPGWLALVDAPVILGRDVSLADTAAAGMPVVIGSDLARGLWGGVSPIGRTLTSPMGPMNKDSITMTVIGVFDATRQLPDATRDRSLARAHAPARVFTVRATEGSASGVLVRTRGPAEPLVADMRRFVRAAAPSLPVLSVQTLAQADAEAYRRTWRVSAMAVAGGALPVLLASLGLFGVVSLAVRQRTREIGIRVALGARPMQVAQQFFASGVYVSAMALVLGLPLSVAAMKLGLSPVFTPEGNPLSVGVIVAAAQMAVASAATWIPARRAALVDPAQTLRAD